MSTFTQILYQIVFSTKNREKILESNKRVEIYKYMWGILNGNKCHPYRINGVEDHLHILTHIHPTVCPADIVKDLKCASSKYIKENRILMNFKNWQDGYELSHIQLIKKMS